MREWQPIETAPKDGTTIDVWNQFYRDGKPTRGRRIPDARWRRGEWVDDDNEPIEWTDDLSQESRVTHWIMPPEPPK